jgi:hypothetical protein
MNIRHQFSISCQTLKRFLFEDEVLATLEVTLQERTLKDEESAVNDSAGYLRFFVKLIHPTFDTHLQLTEAARRAHSGDGSYLPMGPMEL